MKHMKTISRSGRFFLHGLHLLHGEGSRTTEPEGSVASLLPTMMAASPTSPVDLHRWL